MADENTNDPVDVIEMTESTMLGDLMAVVLQELKAAPNCWQKMSEQEQDDTIHRVENTCRQAVRQACHLIASGNRPTLVATVEKVEFKDGVKAVLAMGKFDPSRHDLADATGDTVLVVVSGAGQYMGGADEHQADPDQAEIPLANEAA